MASISIEEYEKVCKELQAAKNSLGSQQLRFNYIQKENENLTQKLHAVKKERDQLQLKLEDNSNIELVNESFRTETENEINALLAINKRLN